jgi:hypothetical protein
MGSLCVADLHVAVNNTNQFNLAMETQEWVPCALLSRRKIFRTAVNNMDVLRSSCKVLDTVVGLLPNCEFLNRFL